MRMQPVAAAEVAQLLVELAAGTPTTRTDLAGPQEEYLPDLVRRLLRARLAQAGVASAAAR